jgi:hypothetical protein
MRPLFPDLKRSGSFASEDQRGWRVEVLPAVIDHEEIVLEHVVVPFFLQLYKKRAKTLSVLYP